MRSDDPANADVLAVIHAGHAPQSILNVRPGQRVDVQVSKRTEDDHVPPPAKPFSDVVSRGAGERAEHVFRQWSAACAGPQCKHPALRGRHDAADEQHSTRPAGRSYTVGTTFPMRALDPAANARTVKEAGLGGMVVVQSRAHRRGKSGHLKRAAEVALRAGEALVPRLTALITASDRARQEQESWGTWKHVGAI
ncbi:hypothetical protein DFH08DRAFT_967457 [Mycena albidolilacea]|uniref:SEP domain-containing protein n=1 Tax=Mycena albidolilacea TaxID=1033008 RepID=A0AAD7EJ69_9AGAR|nr:hypothetical protein DFH08DRAFT_967457 [Mycena albidolilacea]